MSESSTSDAKSRSCGLVVSLVDSCTCMRTCTWAKKVRMLVSGKDVNKKEMRRVNALDGKIIVL